MYVPKVVYLVKAGWQTYSYVELQYCSRQYCMYIFVDY